MGEVLLDVPEHQCEIITHGRRVKLFAILSALLLLRVLKDRSVDVRL